MAKPEARRLRLFYIDDNPPAFPAPTIDVLKLRSLAEVQDRLIANNCPSPDLVVCDVNMAHRFKDHPEDVFWGGDGALPAYGPLLALPFLRSDAICEFVPASSWWAQVRNDGYVLVSVALLLTVIGRRTCDLWEAREWIDEQEAPREALHDSASPGSPTAVALGNPEPHIAISSGLVGLRKKLTSACEEGRLTIAGLDTTIAALSNWKEGEPVEGDGGPVRVELLYPDRSDFVAVNSLFADALSFEVIPDTAQVQRIAGELKTWFDKDPCFQFPRTTSLYEQAVQILTNDLPKKKDRRRGAINGSNRLKERARAAANATGLDPLLLIRTAMIFAFLRAWYFSRILEGVYDDEGGAYGLRDWAYWFLDIHPRKRPPNPFKRLLGVEIDRRIEIGPGRHQRGFDPEARTAFDAYMALEHNKRLSLTPGEKSLGRRFIADTDRFFPKGIRPEHRKIWEPHLEDEMMAYPAWLI